MTRLRRTTLALLLLAVLATTVAWWTQPDAVDPALAEVGARYDVEILRNTWGVPHVFGRTDADVAFGLAYAHAEDDFATIQGALMAARGRLGTLLGMDGAPNDYMVHLLRVDDVVEDGYARLDSATQALCQGYADGLNHYAALHPDQAARGLYPIDGRDVVRGFVHKVPLFFGLDRTLQTLFSEDGPAPATPDAEGPEQTIGSNAFAVAPSRTADGRTFLAVNSHQPWSGPVAWYEAHLHSEEGWDMVGGTFPGAPVILHGHNRRLGWAHTVNRPDLVDVYRLELHPDDPMRYRYDGVWRTLERRTAPITVKLFGPFRWTAERDVLWSAYGPVVQQPHGTYALRFAAYGDVGQVTQWYRMNKAEDFGTWQDAARMRAVPMFNTVYADAEGTIYYLYNGAIPVRDPSFVWTGLVPGDTSATRWTDVLPFEALPQVLNPPSGFVQNANSTPFATTTGPGNPDPATFDAALGIETHLTNRARRALALFGADSSITWEEFVAYKYDRAYAPDGRMARFVGRLLDDATLGDTLRAHLVAWSLQTDPDDVYAALPVLAFQDLLTDYGTTPPLDTLRTRLQDAAAHLRTTFGRLRVPLADMQRLRRGDAVDLGLGGGPDVLHAVHSELAEDGRLVGYQGDSYVLLAAWDSTGAVTSYSINPYGASTDPASPHYADQAPLFVERRLKPVWMDEAAIRSNLKRAYRPGEAVQ